MERKEEGTFGTMWNVLCGVENAEVTIERRKKGQGNHILY